MTKRRKKNNQTGPVMLGLLISLIVIIGCGLFLVRQIKSDDIKSDTVTSSINSLPATSANTESTSETQASVIVITEETTEPPERFDSNLIEATSLILSDAKEMETKFGDKYDNYGYIDGGYTIGDDEVYPHLQFVVDIDENNEIMSTPIRYIIVNKGGRVKDNIYVGMTYEELKEIYGQHIVPIEETSEGCMFAYCEYDNYTVTFEFEFCGGNSVSAKIIAK